MTPLLNAIERAGRAALVGLDGLHRRFRQVPPSHLVAVAALVVAGLIAGALGGWGIDREDEPYVLWAVSEVQAAWSFEPVAARYHSPLSYVVFAAVSDGLDPASIVSLRAVSAAAYLLAVALFGLVARRADPEAAPYAVMVALLVPKLRSLDGVFFEGRAYGIYALVGMSTVLTALFVHEARSVRDRAIAVALFTVSAALCCATHVFGALCPAAVVAVLAVRAGPRDVRTWLIAGGALIALAMNLPWLLPLVERSLESPGSIRGYGGFRLLELSGSRVSVAVVGTALLAWLTRGSRRLWIPVLFAVLTGKAVLELFWPCVMAVAITADDDTRRSLPLEAWMIVVAVAALPPLANTTEINHHYMAPSMLCVAVLWGRWLLAPTGTWRSRIAVLYLARVVVEAIALLVAGEPPSNIPRGPWPGDATLGDLVDAPWFGLGSPS